MSAHTTKVESMAERAHEISSKHGTAEHIYHPRIRSYGRRVEAALPGTLTLIAALVILLLGAGALLPEETARAIHLISS